MKNSEKEEKKYDLAVAYRIYPKVSRNPVIFTDDKYQLVNFCLSSFIKSLGDLKVKVWVILDGCPPKYEVLVKKYFNEKDLIILNTDSIGNQATFGLQIDILSKQDNSENVYFAEDDYYYFPNQFKKMISFLNRFEDVHFVTPYDHLDYYIYELHNHKQETRCFTNHHWRTVNSTCLTFLTKRKTLQKTKKILKSFTKKSRDSSIWFAMTKQRVFNLFKILKFFKDYPVYFSMIRNAWTSCWKYILFSKKRKLWAPIPTIGTHLDKNRLSPAINWRVIFEQELKTNSLKSL